MAWITTIPYKKSTGKLRRIYDRIKGPGDLVDNILQAHSLRPHTLEGHMYLYKNVLHHQDNQIAKWFLETLGIYVSQLNNCQYCVDHHSAGLKKLIDPDTYERIITDLQAEDYSAFEPNQKEALYYAKILTIDPKTLSEKHFKALLHVGYEEGEILEINQVVAYFNYANRTVLGLGVDTKGDILGLSPSGEEGNWIHKPPGIMD